MMSTEMSPLHSLTHTIMLIIIVGLLSLYLQLRNRYADLSYSCANLQRSVRDVSEFNIYCKGTSDGRHGHACLENEESTMATSPAMKAYSHPPKSTINIPERYVQTELASNKVLSVSISESSFNTERTPYETLGSMTLDEFGKTNKDGSTAEVVATVSSADVFPESYISQVELTKAKLYEVLKSQDALKQGTIAPTLGVYSLQPSSTLETLTKKLMNTYSHFNDDQQPHEDDPVMGSATVSNSNVGFGLSVTGFRSISLSISETSRELVHLATQMPNVGKQNFGKTHSDVDSNHNDFEDSTITSTESQAGFVFDCGYDSQSENHDDGEFSHLNFQPAPPNIQPYSRKLGPSNVEVGDDSQADVSSLLKQAGVDDIQTLVQKGTSARCTAAQSGSTCHFENLCYKVAENDFIFLKGEQSVVEKQPSIGKSDGDDLFDISLSTLPDHNAFKFSPIVLPAETLNRFFSVAVVHGKSLIMHRFKPDNVMHVIHDDILPLHHTLKSLDLIQGQENSKVILLLTDTFEIGEYANLYKSLSVVMPIALKRLNYTADILCFTDAYVGLSHSTLWYQYGFLKQQGPLNVNGSDLLLNVREAVHYLSRHFHYNCMFCANGNYLIVLSRKDNRLILNEGELMISLARATKLKVMSVSLELHSLEEIISMVKNSKGIIGMHGSLMSFLIFLQPGSIVIELFPYAVDPSKYTPFKTFCDLPDSGIIYKSWSNQDIYKSVAHPEWAAELGGIHHLSHEAQKFIIDQSNVPEHLCCEDPSWLYHIYQDTEVDVEIITLLTNAALAEVTNLQTNSISTVKFTKNINITPGPVKDLVCKSTDDLIEANDLNVKYLLHWKIPWNLEFIEYVHLEYQLVISEAGNDTSVHLNLPFNVTFHSLNVEKHHLQTTYNVWVRVTIDNAFSGPYVFVMCQNHL